MVMPLDRHDGPADAQHHPAPPKFQAPWSCAGLPVVSIPCGVADDGLPAAIQLIGRVDRESELLSIAAMVRASDRVSMHSRRCWLAGIRSGNSGYFSNPY